MANQSPLSVSILLENSTERKTEKKAYVQYSVTGLIVLFSHSHAA